MVLAKGHFLEDSSVASAGQEQGRDSGSQPC